jgi:RNA polymerase subunit RPABC4/transcription elongation factor Spt4
MYYRTFTDKTKFCRWCGNTKADHRPGGYSSRCYGFSPTPKPTCRVCGSGFDPNKSGREDCCYRHRMDS